MKLSNLIYTLVIILSAASLKKKEKEGLVEKAMPCILTALSNNVIAFYPFSNGSLNDISGNNYHLTDTTTASSS
jgi:hypothetical protein